MEAKLKILKFGGTSVGSSDAIAKVCQILKDDLCKQKVIVVSAPSGVTTLLESLLVDRTKWSALNERILALAADLSVETDAVEKLLSELKEDLDKKYSTHVRQDKILSFGELFSIHLLSSYLQKQDLPAIAVDSRDFLLTDSRFGRAQVRFEDNQENTQTYFQEVFYNDKLPVVSGFIGRDLQGRTTTLGRGGSDLSATFFGRCLNADLVEIWTDTDGVMSADPRKVNDAIVIPSISYKEVIELSNFGAKVMYSRALTPALRGGIPVQISNTFNPAAPGTLIHKGSDVHSFCVTRKENVEIITVFNPEMIGTAGYLSKLFHIFEEHRLSIDVISVSEATVSVTVQNVSKERLEDVKESLSLIGEVTLRDNCNIVAVISKYLSMHKERLSQCLTLLKEESIDIDMISYGNNDINLTFVVDGDKGEKALHCLHKLFKEHHA